MCKEPRPALDIAAPPHRIFSNFKQYNNSCHKDRYPKTDKKRHKYKDKWKQTQIQNVDIHSCSCKQLPSISVNLITG